MFSYFLLGGINILEEKYIDNNKISCIFNEEAPILEEKILQLFDYYVNATLENI